MGIGNFGWDAVDAESGGGAKKRGTGGPRRFWLPAQVTKRVLFLDENPYTLYEHSMWALTKKQDREICLKRNKLADECPICDAEMWPSLTGFFSVIDMGDVKHEKGKVTLEGWTNDAGQNFQFGRKLLGAKRGGRDKPGMLQKIRRLSDKRGGLVGTVWDVYRSGQKSESIGDEYEFVEVVKEKDIRKYLLKLGAEEEYLETTSFNYDEIFVPKTVDELKEIMGVAPENKVTSVDLGDDDDPDFDL